MAEKEYIERETTMHIVKCTCGDYATAFSMIRKLPAADVVEVVRCKDCKHYAGQPDGCMLLRTCVHENFYCEYGEREEIDNG